MPQPRSTPQIEIITDGTTSFAGGVDSLKATTVAGATNTKGIRRDEQCWLINATVRDGGISPRWGWQPRTRIADATGLYQRGFIYQPVKGSPYIIMMVAGHVLMVNPDTKVVTDLSMEFLAPTTTITTITGLTTVTLKNLTDSGHGIPRPGTHQQYGGTFPPPDPILGSYQSFVIPNIGDTVDVRLDAAYLGGAGPTVTFPTFTYHPPPPFGGPDHIVGDGQYEIMSAQGSTTTTTPGGFPLLMPSYPVDPSSPGNALLSRAFFCQAEQFLIIQVGDGFTLPLIWDGNLLRRSVGINNTAIAPGTPSNWNDPDPTHWGNEIPSAGPMFYYMGRLFYMIGRKISAGDIVGGPSGTLGYEFRDAVLNVTENPLVLGGDGFTVPDNSGDIVGAKCMGNINTAQGQGQLYIYTRRAVYGLTVPITRTDWINANSSNQPLMTVVQTTNGAVNDDSIVSVNGDLYSQTYNKQIQSMVAAMRYFQQPGNIPISANEHRILQWNNSDLLGHASGICFDNRLWQTALPYQVPCGVAHQAVVPLDFLPVSSFNEQYSPVWEGHYEGLSFLQLMEADFDGTQRAFAVAYNELDNGIWLWELTDNDKFENGDQRVTMQIEFPAFNWDQPLGMKNLLAAELWVDKLFGTVEFSLEYRVDGETCWIPWLQWKECSARNVNEFLPPTMASPYPTPYATSYRQTITVGKPPSTCSQMQRPSNLGYQFQPRLTVKGYCRVRGIFLKASVVRTPLYHNMVPERSLFENRIVPSPA